MAVEGASFQIPAPSLGWNRKLTQVEVVFELEGTRACFACLYKLLQQQWSMKWEVTFRAGMLIHGNTFLQISYRVEALIMRCLLLQGQCMFLTCFFISVVSEVSVWRFSLTNADNFAR